MTDFHPLSRASTKEEENETTRRNAATFRIITDIPDMTNCSVAELGKPEPIMEHLYRTYRPPSLDPYPPRSKPHNVVLSDSPMSASELDAALGAIRSKTHMGKRGCACEGGPSISVIEEPDHRSEECCAPLTGSETRREAEPEHSCLWCDRSVPWYYELCEHCINSIAKTIQGREATSPNG